MNQEFIEKLKILKDKYVAFQYLCNEWLSGYINNIPFDDLKVLFYGIEIFKKEIDKTVLSLRPYQIIGENEHRREKEIKSLINYIYFASESLMVRTQELFSCLLAKNQSITPSNPA